jgi:Lactonase, 7-bladed beta-propeller
LIAYKVSPNAENLLSEIRYFGEKVYIALRGDNKIMVFKEKEETLEIDFSFKVGKWPRHFAITK